MSADSCSILLWFFTTCEETTFDVDRELKLCSFYDKSKNSLANSGIKFGSNGFACIEFRLHAIDCVQVW